MSVQAYTLSGRDHIMTNMNYFTGKCSYTLLNLGILENLDLRNLGILSILKTQGMRCRAKPPASPFGMNSDSGLLF